LNHPDAPGRPFRALISDRDSMSSDMLARMLELNGRWSACAVQPGDLPQALISNPTELVIVAAEVQYQSRSGFDLAEALTRSQPNVSIVVLLNHSSYDSVINAFHCGARGVFCRERPMAEFLDCVEHVRKGFVWAGGAEAQFLLDAFRSIPSSRLATIDEWPSLTAREREVVLCVARGKTNRAIGLELGLSEHTVKNYLFRAFEKLGVSNRVELLFNLTLRRYASDLGESHGVNTT
jgi:two-component system, NarL family, nitrate/nitrite response regulator NarL